MLDRTKLIKELDRLGPVLFKEYRSFDWFTCDVWQQLTHDPGFIKRLDQAAKKQQLVQWQGELGAIIDCASSLERYAVCAVDGSQIYPDKHLEGLDCFLINAAGCFLHYADTSSARFFSEPRVYAIGQCSAVLPFFSVDMVDLMREEHEFEAMVDSASYLVHAARTGVPIAALFDGNLLFWHLESRQSSVKDLFMGRYTQALDALQQLKIPVAGYLSAPGFHDLVTLVQVGWDAVEKLLDPGHAFTLKNATQSMTDAELLTHVLKPGQRTVLFACNCPLVKSYPTGLAPYFFYLHTGVEIVRIELSEWVAHDQQLVDMLCAICMDQCVKGYGYPVSLAEAHNHAVVKGTDRDFFYQFIYQKAAAHSKRVFLSQKNLKKRMMSI